MSQDIYKLVEEVNAQKLRNGAGKIDDIYNLLDGLDNDSTPVNELRGTINESYGDEKVKLADYDTSTTRKSVVIKKPVVPSDVGNYDTRSAYFFALIAGVKYNDNPTEYVQAHRGMLEKYYREAQANMQDLQLVEARALVESKEYGGKTLTTLTQKGESDGIFYVLRALKRSESLVAEDIYRILKKELG